MEDEDNSISTSASTSQIATLPAFPTKPRKTQLQNAIPVRRRPDSRRRSRRIRRRDSVKAKKENVNGCEEEEGEEVERKIKALQRIVPGGESLGVDKLFDETAGYIIALQCQLKAMRALTCLFEGFEKEKSKFGG